MSDINISEKIIKSLLESFKKTNIYRKIEISVNIVGIICIIGSINLIYNHINYSNITDIQKTQNKLYNITNYSLDRIHNDILNNYKSLDISISKHHDGLVSLLQLNHDMFKDYRFLIREFEIIKSEINAILNILYKQYNNKSNEEEKSSISPITSSNLLQLTLDTQNTITDLDSISIQTKSPANMSTYMLSDDEIYAECYKMISTKNM